ncbi:TPA: Paratox [Streptococcus pyogenes]|uniref:competence regulator inhibitor paratox n=1 Tax=Streptococcus pyogenes TaxID=1314 RepID=UPI0010A14337|nr:Paratox [Streptococcus pyogenes]VGU74951.1 paratox [Streptococcus pyogenes]VGV18782.1 paratox [Streptococcus pyogenes]VGV96049.1 paratox [Streptococcus pyogenes]VHC60141.1 paratox [Streptococcus pyogenes]HEP6116707.1 Paratox [Streptococcus pyogenes]
MLYIDEFKEAIDKGYILGDTVAIVRKNGKIFDYVLPHEKVRDDEVVTVERVEDVMVELDYIK